MNKQKKALDKRAFFMGTSMNKHQKLAILIAPFLIIGGYVAADYYMLAKQEAVLQQQIHRFELSAPCNLHTQYCHLKTGALELQLSLNQSKQQLRLRSNHALDGATISLNRNKAKPLYKEHDPLHWQMTTDANGTTLNKLRLATSVNKVFYFAEINLTP